jgi:transposase-like protein
LEEAEKMAMKGRKRTVYDPEVKEAVVDEAVRTTIVKAAKQWGIPAGTVAYWHCRRRRKDEEVGKVLVVHPLVPNSCRKYEEDLYPSSEAFHVETAGSDREVSPQV